MNVLEFFLKWRLLEEGRKDQCLGGVPNPTGIIREIQAASTSVLAIDKTFNRINIYAVLDCASDYLITVP